MPSEYVWRGEVCKKCWQPNHIGYHLDDHIWKQVSIEIGYRYTILCIPCLDELAIKKGIDWVQHLSYRHNTSGEKMYELYPCSTIGWND